MPKTKTDCWWKAQLHFIFTDLFDLFELFDLFGLFDLFDLIDLFGLFGLFNLIDLYIILYFRNLVCLVGLPLKIPTLVCEQNISLLWGKSYQNSLAQIANRSDQQPWAKKDKINKSIELCSISNGISHLLISYILHGPFQPQHLDYLKNDISTKISKLMTYKSETLG